MGSNRSILVVDDERDIRDSLKMVLSYEGYEVRVASGGAEAVAACATEVPDLIFLDVKMPGMDGLEVLSALVRQGYAVPIVMISGHGTIETACQALRQGAYDFVEKPLATDRVLALVRNALETRRLAEENRALKLRFDERYQLIGSSSQMTAVQQAIRKAAPTNATVLITGESGTGKELVARALHRNSRRASKPFIQVNCAAIPEDLIESELFGHEKGSFTGASDKQVGKFVQADGGTMFLDEVADMSLRTQAKVLRVLQEGDVEPVGAGRVVRVDVRVLAATNKDLEAEIEAGRLRQDLFFRLNVVNIQVPSLSMRREDIPELVEYFVKRLAQDNGVKPKAVSKGVVERLASYRWRGNIRELRNVLERALIMAEGNSIEVTDLPNELHSEAGSTVQELQSGRTLRQFKEAAERSYLVARLRENGWNISVTAQTIDTPRSNLYKKIDAYGIRQEDDG